MKFLFLNILKNREKGKSLRKKKNLRADCLILRKFTSNLTWKNYYDMYHDDEEHHARCLECGDEIGYGRTDRKFCSLSCKNRYNNRKNQDSRRTKLKVLNALNRNHEILDGLLKMGMTEMNISDLKHLGFDTDYMTSCYRTRGHTEFCCFDIRYHVTPTRITSIFRMKRNLSAKDE